MRSDSAEYQSNLLTYCGNGKKPRFGFISEAFSCPVETELEGLEFPQSALMELQ